MIFQAKNIYKISKKHYFRANYWRFSDNKYIIHFQKFFDNIIIFTERFILIAVKYL